MNARSTCVRFGRASAVGWKHHCSRTTRRGCAAFYAGLDAGAIEEYVAVLSEPGALVAAFDWYRSMSGAASAATPAASMPTLYVWSDQDRSLGRDAAEATASFVAGPYRFEVLEGVGHWIPELAADKFMPLLLEHLATGS